MSPRNLSTIVLTGFKTKPKGFVYLYACPESCILVSFLHFKRIFYSLSFNTVLCEAYPRFHYFTGFFTDFSPTSEVDANYLFTF